MNGRELHERDVTVVLGISGAEDMFNSGIHIEEEGYLLRERMENRREQGFDVPEEFRPTQMSERERRLWKEIKDMERLERERCCPLDSANPEIREEEKRRKGWPETDWEDRMDLGPTLRIIEV
jgi:hypothetical protein